MAMGLNKSRICFVSDNETWGGSEELWSQSALYLATKGMLVTASVSQSIYSCPRIASLINAGVQVQRLPRFGSLSMRGWHRIFGSKPKLLERFLRAASPALVVLSSGRVLPRLELMELCKANRWAFVALGHCNYEGWCPDEETAERFRNVLPSALRCYFVAKTNQVLVERRLGHELPNAEIIHNPFNVAFNVAQAWPCLGKDGEIRLACVGRLESVQKGQDILLEVLAQPPWKGRRWRLTLYGDGPSKGALKRLVNRSGLKDRVMFAGHVKSAEEIWSTNHALVMPSRFEGLPLAIVEAMLCARPVVATDVGGIREILEDGVTGFLANVATPTSVQAALEHLWSRRLELEDIGKAAAKRIRALVTSDPVGAFSNKLQQLL